MRDIILFLTVLGAVLLGILVLLPVLGVLFMVLVGLLALAAVLFLAAPLLAKLPWFRDWITVDEYGGRRFIRFGKGGFTASRGGRSYRNPYQKRPAHDEDVIDVEGREIPEKDK